MALGAAKTSLRAETGTLPALLAGIPQPKPEDKMDCAIAFLHSLPKEGYRPRNTAHGGITGIVSVDIDQEPSMGWEDAFDKLSEYDDLTVMETHSGKIAAFTVIPPLPITGPKDFASLTRNMAKRLAARVEGEPDLSATDLARGRFVWGSMRIKYGTALFGAHDRPGEGYPDATWFAYFLGYKGVPLDDHLNYLVHNRVTPEVLRKEYEKGAEAAATAAPVAPNERLQQAFTALASEDAFVVADDIDLRLVHNSRTYLGFNDVARAITRITGVPIGLGRQTETALLIEAPSYDATEAFRMAMESTEVYRDYAYHINWIADAWKLDDQSKGALARGIQSIVLGLAGEQTQDCLFLFGGGNLGKSALLRELLTWTHPQPGIPSPLKLPLVPSSTAATKQDDLDAIQGEAQLVILDELNLAAIGTEFLKTFISDGRSVRRKYDRHATVLQPVPTVITTNEAKNVPFTNDAPDRRFNLVALPLGLTREETEAAGRQVREYCRDWGRDILAAAYKAERLPYFTPDREYWEIAAGREDSRSTLEAIRDQFGSTVFVTQHINQEYDSFGFDKPADMKVYLLNMGATKGKEDRQVVFYLPPKLDQE